MTGDRESAARTVGVAVLVALICSLLVSAVVYLLRPYELAYSALERNRAILEAAGLVMPGEQVSESELVSRFVELDARVVDLANGTFTEDLDPVTYDYRAAFDDAAMREPIPDIEDIGRLGFRPRYMTVYLVVADDGRIETLVLPLFARGMWSTIYGFLALRGDFRTIAGVAFYEHGETPGIGDRIEAPEWLSTWVGKRLYGPDDAVRFRIGAASPDVANEYRVDSITGATMTVTGVGDGIRYWLSDHGYGRLLRSLREAGN